MGVTFVAKTAEVPVQPVAQEGAAPAQTKKLSLKEFLALQPVKLTVEQRTQSLIEAYDEFRAAAGLKKLVLVRKDDPNLTFIVLDVDSEYRAFGYRPTGKRKDFKFWLSYTVGLEHQYGPKWL